MNHYGYAKKLVDSSSAHGDDYLEAEIEGAIYLAMLTMKNAIVAELRLKQPVTVHEFFETVASTAFPEMPDY